MLLSEAFAAYYQVLAFKNQSKKTAEMHRLALKSLRNSSGDINIEDLTFMHVRDWKEKLESEGKTQNTIRGYIIKLRLVLSNTRRLKVPCMDVEDIPVPKRENTVPSWITPEEVTKLIGACNKNVHAIQVNKLRGKAIIAFLYSSGIRVTELCNVNRDQLIDGRFTVIGKGNKPRLCFYDARSAALIEQYLLLRADNHPALFIQQHSPVRMNKGGVEHIFKCARKQAGFNKPITPHTMRHSLASSLMQNGIPIYSLSRILGHASIQTTSIYLHVTDHRLEEEYRRYHTNVTTPVLEVT